MNITKTNIETQILASYTKLNYTPRGNQLSIVFSVVNSFLNKGMKNVVLSAPTGIGKSILSAVISDTIDFFTPKNESLPSIIMMGTNSLSQQYSDSFSKLGESEFFRVMGASNYPCAYMESQLSSISSNTADECVYTKLLPVEVEKYCNGCAYNKSKRIINTTQNLITNYTYFMISALASDHLKPRKLHIFDEAHVVSDWFCNYAEIIVSVDLINKYIKELGDCNGKCDTEIANLIILKQTISDGGINESNYKICLENLLALYKDISLILSNQSVMLQKLDIIKSAKFDKMSRKYVSIGNKISDLFDNEYDHVFDNTIPNVFTVKTIFIGKMTEKLLTDYNLFMSATITKSYAYEILKLNQSETEIINLPAVFPPENKKLFFIGKSSLNYNTLKDPDTITTLKLQIRKIVEFHGDKKGIVLVPSFYLGNQLSFGVKYTKVFEHKSGVNLSDLIHSYKNYDGSCILVSPSIYEGVDLPQADFQIIVKAPYPSLADLRIKHIASKYPSIYQEMTLLKIIQGTGRGVRSPTDTASTFFLDSSCKKLFDSSANIWKSHFEIHSN